MHMTTHFAAVQGELHPPELQAHNLAPEIKIEGPLTCAGLCHTAVQRSSGSVGMEVGTIL